MSRSVGERYVAAINAEDGTALMALFAEGAVLHHPLGTFTGREEMLGFYTDVVFAGKAQTEIVTSCVEEHREWIEIEATSPLGDPGNRVHAADVFDLDGEGLVQRLAIYYR